MSEDPTAGWSADDPSDDPPAGPENAAEATPETSEGEETGQRGTRAERRSARDQSTRDESARTERDEHRARADRLAQQVNAMRSAELLRHAAGHLAVPDDLLLATTVEERAAVWKDDGTMDEGLLSALLDGVVTKHPHWSRADYVRRSGGGLDMGRRGVPSSSSSSVTWSDVIKG